MSKKRMQIIWGVCLLIFALGLALQIFFHEILFEGWWTLFLIIPSAIGLFSKENRVTYLVILVIGVLLLLGAQNWIDWGMITALIPVMIIVAIGLSLLRMGASKSKGPKQVQATGGKERYTAIFSGHERRYDNQPFHGAQLTAIFGGVELDLRDAIIEEDIQMETTSIFGGCTLRMPSNVNVVVSGSNILGGTENKLEQDDAKQATVYLSSFTLFGGCEVK